MGFIIAALVAAPPVYDPGGPTCFVDDFTVETADDWPLVGRLLLDRAVEAAKARGAVQASVNCALADDAKRRMLAEAGYVIANAVHVSPL